MALPSISRWFGRYALVTGASYGIGSEICRGLTRHGINVIGCGRSVDKIKVLSAEVKAAGGQGQAQYGVPAPGVLHPYQCDLSSEPEIIGMFDWIETKFGGVDICINNAGVAYGEPIIGCTTEKVRNMLDLNVVALLSCDNKALASMQARGVDDGHIFHINSLLGHKVSAWNRVHTYGATKYAVTQITEALRQELQARGSRIRVTAISPAVVDTSFLPQSVGGQDAADKFTKAAPVLRAKDVADTLIFALSAPESVQIHDIILRATGAI